MSSPQEQFAELSRRTQENFKNLWQQWSERSTELMKGLSGRSQPTATAPGNPGRGSRRGCSTSPST